MAQPPNDAISAIDFAPDAPRFLVSSWDKNVYLYEIASGSEQATLINTFEHRAPVLSVCFGANQDEAFTAGMDRQVKKINLATGEQTVLSKHSEPVRCVVYSPEHCKSCLPLSLHCMPSAPNIANC